MCNVWVELCSIEWLSVKSLTTELILTRLQETQHRLTCLFEIPPFFFFPPPCWCTSSWDVCSCMASGSLWEEASWRICKKQNKNKIKNKKNPPPPSPPPQTPKSQPPKPERTCCLYFKMQKLMLWMLALLSDWWNEKTLSCALLILDLIKCGSHTLLNRVLNVCQLRCDHSHWFGGLLGSASSGQGKYTFGAIW